MNSAWFHRNLKRNSNFRSLIIICYFKQYKKPFLITSFLMISQSPVLCQYCQVFIDLSVPTILKHSQACQHVQRPNSRYQFICVLCDYHTYHRGNMSEHIRRHIGKKPYKCFECSYESSHSSDLIKHSKIKHSTWELDYFFCG